MHETSSSGIPEPGQAVATSECTDLVLEDSLFRLIFQEIREGVALHRIEYDESGKAVDYRILEVNPTFERHTHKMAADLRGRLASEVFETYPPPFLAEFSQAAVEGGSLRFESTYQPLGRHFFVSAVSLRPGYIAVLFLDQTEQKQLQEENDNIFLNTVDCICIATLDGWFLKVNPSWTRVLGWTAGELKSRPYFELIHPDDLGATIGLRELEAPYRALEGFENRYRCKDGSYRWLAWSAFMTVDRVYAVARDVTAARTNARKMEDLLVKISEQGLGDETQGCLDAQFAGIVHEAMNPLGMALTTTGFQLDTAGKVLKLLENPDTQLSRKTLEDAVRDLQDSAMIIQHNLERASDLLGSFKQVAVDQGSGIKRSFSLAQLVDQTLLSLSPQFKKTRITCHVECPPDISMHSYPGTLSQVLTNLLINSLVHGFHDRPDGSIRINAALMHENPGQVEICIRDNGWGIPPEHREKVFEPFFTTAAGEGGSGLGLAIVKGLVTRKLAGQVFMHSSTREEDQATQGTTFKLRLPLSCPD